MNHWKLEPRQLASSAAEDLVNARSGIVGMDRAEIVCLISMKSIPSAKQFQYISIFKLQVFLIFSYSQKLPRRKTLEDKEVEVNALGLHMQS